LNTKFQIKSVAVLAISSLSANLQAEVVEEIHADISGSLTDFIVSVDQFFGDGGRHEDDSSLIIDIESSWLHSRYIENEHNLKYRAQFRLDELDKRVKKLGKRIELVVEPNDPLPEGDQQERLMTDQPTSSVHLQVSDHRKPLFKYQAGHNGFKSLYVGASFDHQMTLRSSQLELNSQYRYTSQNVSQLVLAPSINQQLADSWQHVIYFDYRYLSDQNDQAIAYGAKLRQQMNQKHGIAFSLSSKGTTQHSYQSVQHLATLDYRNKLYSDWMYLDAQLFNRWQRSRNFASDPGISLGLNIYFGR